MYISDVDVLSQSAVKKYKNANENPGKYMIRAIMTGFYVIVAIILSYTLGAILYPKYPEVSKVLVAATFSFALALIVFLSGELFTGNNLVMSVGMYTKKTTLSMAIKVWIYSYIGNFIGSVIVSYLFIKSGASLGIIQNYIVSVTEAKLNLPVYQLLIRGMLCNFIVCLGYLSGVKMKTESGKMVMMFWCVFAFILAGFEHSIANMGVFSIAQFAVGGFPISLMARNLLWVTIGNIIGGGLLLGLPVVAMSVEE